jgi:hypothetical protein
VNDLKDEEMKKMEMWASAMSSLISAEENADVTLEQEILSSNSTIPVILTDGSGSIIQYNNIDLDVGADTLAVLMELVADMRRGGRVIPVPMGELGEQYACYDDSMILTQLAYYPYVQLAVVLLFFVICFVAILNSKRAEQNRVWVGLSKETAHQLGTPISSLMAWTTVLKEKYPDDDMLPVMERDVTRLQMVAERFSKIGSKPEPTSEDLVDVIERAVEYMKHRSPANVRYETSFPKRPLLVRMNAPLIEWVVENGKRYLVVNDFVKLRELFGKMLYEIQRIKSEGDFEAGKALVEQYAVKVDADLHREVLERYRALNIEPYGGFVNPEYELVKEDDKVVDVKISYPADYTAQMLNYAKNYSFLPNKN